MCDCLFHHFSTVVFSVGEGEIERIQGMSSGEYLDLDDEKRLQDSFMGVVDIAT